MIALQDIILLVVLGVGLEVQVPTTSGTAFSYTSTIDCLTSKFLPTGNKSPKRWRLKNAFFFTLILQIKMRRRMRASCLHSGWRMLGWGVGYNFVPGRCSEPLVIPVYFSQSDRDLVSRPCIEELDELNSWGECGGRDLP